MRSGLEVGQPENGMKSAPAVVATALTFAPGQQVAAEVFHVEGAALQGTSARLWSPPGSLALQTGTRCASLNLGGTIASIRGVVQGQQVAVVPAAAQAVEEKKPAVAEQTTGPAHQVVAMDMSPALGQQGAVEVWNVERVSPMA